MNTKATARCATLFVMLCACGLMGCGSSDQTDIDRSVTYVCTETDEVIVGPPQSTPAMNPQTGRRTLLRGVYCSECQKWYAAPSSDHLNGNPGDLRCDIHDIPMTTELPTETETE